MLSGLYIGTKNSGDYGLLSTGDYINPLAMAFRIRDTGNTLEKTQLLYLIVNNIEVEYVRIEYSGQMLAVRPQLSWDKKNWSSSLTITDTLSYLTSTFTKEFYVMFNIDDVSSQFIQSDVNRLTNFKLRIIYG